jgi:hypothetical protein
MFFLVPGLIVGALVVVGAIWSYRNARLLEEAADWPTTEATIQQTELQEFNATSKSDVVHSYPCLMFTYIVNGEYYSGTFGLAVEGEKADRMIEEWANKKLTVSYRPAKTSEYYVPDELMEGYEVLQKLSARGNPSPKA